MTTMTPCLIIIIIISRAELIGTAGVNFFPFFLSPPLLPLSFVKMASSTMFPFFYSVQSAAAARRPLGSSSALALALVGPSDDVSTKL
jgi:hypothetical protein